MTIEAPGHDGQSYGPYAGFCLEAQHFPDSLHNPDWPSIVATPDAPYFQRLVRGDRTRPDGPGVRARLQALDGIAESAAVNGSGTALTAGRKP